MPDIVGLGDSSVDLFIEVDHIAGHDEKVRGHLLSKQPGGIIGNFCCAAARFGSSTGIVTTVGDDEFGRSCREDYRHFGVEITNLVVRENEATYFCVVFLDASGEKALTIVQTPLLMPQIKDIDLAYLRRARYLHLPSLSLEVAYYVVHALKDHQTGVSIDIEPTADGASISEWEDVLRYVAIVFINDQSLRPLFGSDDADACARRLLELGVGTVAMTSGARGGAVYTRDESFRYPAFLVPVKDATGAGDCFSAVFLSGLNLGWDLRRSARFASAAAAMSVREVGARAGLPTLADIERFLQEAEVA